MDPAYPYYNECQKFSAWLFSKLRELPGIEWDESVPPTHTSYEDWWAVGTTTPTSNNVTTASSSIMSPATPTPTISSPNVSQQSRAATAPTRTSSPSSPVRPPLPGRSQSSRRTSTESFWKHSNLVVARLSRHSLRLERQYQLAKHHVGEHDSEGKHYLVPIQLLRLPPRQDNEPLLSVIIYADPGHNSLRDMVSCGPAYFEACRMPSSKPWFPGLDALGNNDAPSIPISTFLDFAIGACEALEILHHGSRIVHGELRNDSFHFDRTTGAVRLITFGSGVRSLEHGLSSSGWNSLSREYGIEYKLGFVAPEMTGRLPAAPDLRTDIYSLGIIFYNMLTQEIPFPGTSALEVLQLVLSRRIPLVSSKRYDVPDALALLIQKMIKKNIEDRYHSMSGVKWDLEQIQKLLDEGNRDGLEKFKIGSRDVNSFFTLPNVQIGRDMDRDRILHVIERVSNALRKRQSHGRAIPSPNKSSRSSSSSDTGSFGNVRGKSSPTTAGVAGAASISTSNGSDIFVQLPPIVMEETSGGFDEDVFTARSSEFPEKRMSLDSGSDNLLRTLNSTNTSENPSNLLRNASKYKRKGFTEVITISGSPGLGKSRLLQSVLVDARFKGYTATSKFDQLKRTPFAAVLTLMVSLFRQIYSEADVDSQFHQSLRAFVRPVWPMLSAMLDLPDWILDGQVVPGKFPNGNSTGNHHPVTSPMPRKAPNMQRRASGPSNERICGKKGHTINDFLRAGTSSKSSRFMAVFVDVLRFLSTYRLIVLVIDDLQFADDESLDLLNAIVASRVPIVLIMTYRVKDQLTEKAKSFLADAPSRTEIVLLPLREDDVAEYVIATLHRTREYTFPLVAVIYQKTHGNPFFMKEMLEASYRKNCIWYSWKDSQWCFDLDAIFREFSSAGYGYGDEMGNDFIVARLNDVPGSVRTFLSWASLLGTTFSFPLIKALMQGIYHHDPSVTDSAAQSKKIDGEDSKRIARNLHHFRAELPRQSSQDALRGLQGAIAVYMIMPAEDDNHFRWCHDRYQTAASSLIEKDHVAEMHFAISHLLLDTHEFDDEGDGIWTRASHICACVDLIKERVPHRGRYRDALFRAAEKATESGGKGAGLTYFANALALLQQKDPWDETQPDVSYTETLQLFSRCAECYYRQGFIEPSSHLIGVIFRKARNSYDKVPAWILQSRIIARRGDNSGAIRSLKTCLQHLGLEVPTLTWEECDAKYDEIKAQLDKRNLEDFITQPLTTDQNVITTVSVLIEALASGFWTDGLIFFQLSLVEIDLVLQKGTTTQTALALIHLGCCAIGRFNDVQFGCRLGDVANSLVMKHQSDLYTYGRGLTLYCMLLGHFSSPMKDAIPRLEAAMEACLAVGDRFGALLNVGFLASARIWCSHDLSEVEAYCTYGAEELSGWQDDVRGGVYITGCRQYARALQGKTSHHEAQNVLSDSTHNSQAYLEYVSSRLSNPTRAKCTYAGYQIAALYSFGHYQEVIELGDAVIPLLYEYFSIRFAVSIPFYWSLAQMALLRDDDADLKKDEILAQCKKHYDRIITWSAVNDANFVCWSSLLEAQLDEFEDKYPEALIAYERALDHAEVHELSLDYAIGSELYGEFMVRRGAKRPAKMALEDSIANYRRISAFGKARHLAEKHEWLLRGTASLNTQDASTQTLGAQASLPPPKSQLNEEHPSALEDHGLQKTSSKIDDDALGATGLDMIDLTGIVRSTQVLASELQIDRLFSKMCRIILDSTSAEICAIVVDDDDHGWCLGICEDTNGNEMDRGATLDEIEGVVGKQVVLSALRFREVVFLQNMYDDDRFRNVPDAYRQKYPEGRAVICLPIIRGETILGCVYLEAPPHTLTQRNVNVAQLLVNSLGISVANAKLFKKVEKVSASNEAIVESLKQALTRTKASENEAKAAFRRAEEAAKAKSAFLANVSHELRTPLNGVIGMSELLKSSILTTEQEGYADSIRVCADTLLTVINDILDFSKLEAGKMQMFPVPLSLPDTIEEVVRALSFSGLGKDLETIQDIDVDRELLVMSDPVRLHQILMNLLSNAYKFTPKGSVTVGAKVEWEGEKEIRIVCSVTDTGIGISEESKQKLFLPFSQADSSTARSYGGTGLGLSICRAIIENVMGGKIWLDSKEGEGTRVSFMLTLKKVSEEDGKNKGTRNDPMAIYSAMEGVANKDNAPDLDELARVPKAKIRVCIAEDNAVNMKIAMQFVKKIGLRVEAYPDGQQAVDALTAASKDGDPFHVVLMDVQMPVLDGYNATRAIRKHKDPIVRKVLIIAMTASAIRGDREKCLEAGMNNYLAKPVRQQVLKHMLDSYLTNDAGEIPSVHRDSNSSKNEEKAVDMAKQMARKADADGKETAVKNGAKVDLTAVESN